MSRELVQLAMNAPVTKELKATGCNGSTKALLVAMAHAIPEGSTLLNISIAALAEAAGLCERTTKRHLRWLEAHDWITTLPRPNATSHYLIHKHTLAELAQAVTS